MKRHNSLNLVKGFTLIEVLIALMITAIVGAMSYAGLDAAIDALENQEKHQEELNELNTLFAIMGRDFRQVISRSVRDEFGETEAAFYAEDDAFVTLKLTRLGWRNPRPDTISRSEMQRVEYRLEDKKLIRKFWYVLDRTSDEYGAESVLLDKVSEIKFRFLAPAVTAEGLLRAARWVDSWPLPSIGESTGTKSALPLGVEITIDIEGFGQIKRLYELPNG